MAKTIPQLLAGTETTDTDLFPYDSGIQSYRIPAAKIRDYMQASVSIAVTGPDEVVLDATAHGKTFLMDASGGAVVFRLPYAVDFKDKWFRIKDVGPSLHEDKPVVDNSNGQGSIEGSPDPYILKTRKGCWIVYCDGTGFWFLSNPDIVSSVVQLQMKKSALDFKPFVLNAGDSISSGAYFLGDYVFVASFGTNRIYRSIDGGRTFLSSAPPQANSWTGLAVMEDPLAAGGGTWVAVARDGTNRVMRSQDRGASWTLHSAAEANPWQGVARSATHFVAVSNQGTNRVMRSTDGTSWTAVSAAEQNAWTRIAVNPETNTLIAIAIQSGSAGSNWIMRSTDNGATWTPIPHPVSSTGFSEIAYGGGKWIITQLSNDAIVSTDDGLTWQTLPGSLNLIGSSFGVYGNGIWYFSDYVSFDNLVTFERMDYGTSMFCGVFGNNRFVIASGSGGGANTYMWTSGPIPNFE